MISNNIARIFYEVITIFPGRSTARQPWGWNKHIRGALLCRAVDSPLGLMLTIETNDLAEAFKLRDLIRSWNPRWEDTGGHTSVEITETQTVKRTRIVEESENVLPDHSDSLWKRRHALAAGVPFSPQWVDDDRRAQQEHEERLKLEDANDRRVRAQYWEARLAFETQQANSFREQPNSPEAYQAWLRRPQFPPIEEWQRAIECGEEPQLLLPPAPVDVEPVVNSEVVDPERVAPDPEILADLIWALEDASPATLQDLASRLQTPEALFRPTLDRALADGRIREDQDGFHLVTEG